MEAIFKIVLLVFVLCGSPLAKAQWHWELGAEFRYLPQDPPYGVDDHGAALSARGEYNTEWNDGSDLFEFEGFYRWSGQDSERTHGDIQDLAWIHVADGWELRSGIRTVFWGVTEFQHLVNIINQVDLVEWIDGEKLLGQPMVNLSLVREWGIVDLFVLPGFRERTFPGEDGWPRGAVLFSGKDAVYESSREDQRVDFALRWMQSFDVWELAASYFSGTSREPEFHAFNDDGELIPYYAVIDQIGLEAQVNVDAWIGKFEAISRSGQEGGRYGAATIGFEYTIEGVMASVSDLGIVVEYNFDERGDDSPSTYFLDDDIALGLRWALNDVHSSDLLVGLIYDINTAERFLKVEGNRRLADVWKLSINAVFFSSQRPPSLQDLQNGSFDPLYKLASNSRNDLIQVELFRYF